MHDLLKLDEAAARLGVHVTTLRAWVREHRIPSYRLGQRFVRVDWADVLRAVSVDRPGGGPRPVESRSPGGSSSQVACVAEGK